MNIEGIEPGITCYSKLFRLSASTASLSTSSSAERIWVRGMSKRLAAHPGQFPNVVQRVLHITDADADFAAAAVTL